MPFSVMLSRRLRPLGVGLLVAALSLGGRPASAQSGMRSVEAVGAGGSSSAVGSRVASLYANPAHLTVGETDHALELQLFRVGAYTGGDLFQFEHYRDLFVHAPPSAQQSDAQKKSTLEEWFGSSTRGATTSLEVVPLSMTYRSPERRWAVGGGIRGRIVQKTTLNRGLFDLLLRGTETDRTVPVDGRTRLYSTVDLTGAFSYRFSTIPLSVGASPRLIVGTGYADGVLDSEVVVEERALTHRFDYTARAAGAVSTGLYDSFDLFSPQPIRTMLGSSTGRAGLGGGFDLGATYTVRPGLHVSMSVTDVGGLRWTEAAQTVTPRNNTFAFEGFPVDVQRLEAEFGGDVASYLGHHLDSLARAAYRDVERERSSFATGLPTTLHATGTWDPNDVTVHGGVSVGLNENAGAVPRPLAVYAGGEAAFGPVPVRAGVRLWGARALSVAGGLGLNVGRYRVDVGGSLTPSTSFLGSGARYAVSVSLGTVRI